MSHCGSIKIVLELKCEFVFVQNKLKHPVKYCKAVTNKISSNFYLRTLLLGMNLHLFYVELYSDLKTFQS